MEQPLYDTLRGNWSVNREIEDRFNATEDRTGGQGGFFTGTAQFSGDIPNLAYREKGTLAIGGTSLQAERQYIWQCHASSVTVLHKDGTPFHDFTLIDGSATAEHVCGNDLYRGAYWFRSPAEWQVTWVVCGPRKDFTSKTTYHRTVTLLQ